MLTGLAERQHSQLPWLPQLPSNFYTCPHLQQQQHRPQLLERVKRRQLSTPTQQEQQRPAGRWMDRLYDCDRVRKYTRYSYFHVEGSSVNYKLHINGYSGTAGDSLPGLHSLNEMQLSTRDRDNDNSDGNWFKLLHQV